MFTIYCPSPTRISPPSQRACMSALVSQHQQRTWVTGMDQVLGNYYICLLTDWIILAPYPLILYMRLSETERSEVTCARSLG